GVKVRGIHLIGEHVLFADREERLRFGVRDVRVRRIGWTGAVAAVPFSIKPVHLAVGARDASGPVAGSEVARGIVLDVPPSFESDRRERYLLAGTRIAVRARRCARKPVEEIVERAVLLNDDDDVLDLAAGRMMMNPRRRGDILVARRQLEPRAVAAAAG